MILKGPEKTVQKVKLRVKTSILRVSFRDTFADTFFDWFGKVDLQILLRFRPARALLGNIFNLTFSDVDLLVRKLASKSK